MRLPDPLQFNDHAIILSPSGNIEDYLVHDTAAIIREWGLIPKISKYALGESGRFSGTVEERLHDLQEAFNDPSIKLIICSRGGYGVVHLLEKINFDGIRKCPKWVVGYSDITAIHSALQVNGIASLHAPMAKHFSDEGVNDLSVRYTKSLLSGQSVDYEIPVAKNFTFNRQGRAIGKLFGGNLSVLCGIIGTPFLRIPNNGILFIEEIGEAPYKVDRMIYQLKLAGVFKRINALIIGKFTDYEEDEKMYFSLKESILDATKEYNIPIGFEFPVGHVKLNFPLIMGEVAELLIQKDKILFKQQVYK
jgi:muramoyltetrapeptide carboxypeptidase